MKMTQWKLGTNIGSVLICMMVLSISFLSVINCITGKKYDVAENGTNSVLNSCRIDETINLADQFLKTHLFRKGATTVDNVYTYALTKQVHSGQVSVGYDTWLYLMECMDNYEGKTVYTEEETEKCIRKAQSLQDYCLEKGCDFAVLFGPDKQSIYPEFVSDEFIEGGKRRTEKLFEIMRDSGINAVDPGSSLMHGKELYPVYYKNDTHWNQIGGYLAVKEVLKTWGVEMPDLEEVSVSSYPLKGHYHVSAKDDLAQATGLRSTFFNDGTEYVIDGTYGIDWEELKDNEWGDFHFHNPEAPLKKRVLLIGDSFRIAMMPSLAMMYKDVFVHSTIEDHIDYNEIYQKTDPDCVIIVFTERGFTSFWEK